jgi:hypothetical protein
MLPKNIFLLWLQGWDNAKWLNKQVAESWKINNPDWTIHYIDFENLKDYVSDIDYIYDTTKDISPQAKSDIIRLSLLKNHGGIWADATLMCMQPLDHWVFEAVEPSGFWMYRGNGGSGGISCWFIVSQKDNYVINKWKEEADNYWLSSERVSTNYWLDLWFSTIFNNNDKVRELWLKVKSIYCEDKGQAHTMAHHFMWQDQYYIKDLFYDQPPYVLKFWLNAWEEHFPDPTTEKCKKSNGYYAIECSKRVKSFKHPLV